MLIICFSDLQCINTTFVKGNGKIANCLINELTHAFIVGVMYTSPCHRFIECTDVISVNSHPIIYNYSFYYKRKAEQKLNNNIIQNVAYLAVHQQTTEQTEEDYNTIPDINFPINNDSNNYYEDIIAGEHTYINTSTIPLENSYANISEHPPPPVQTSSQEPLHMSESENTITYQMSAETGDDQYTKLICRQ